jgi:ABC-type sugar transport system ATPase subunit
MKAISKSFGGGLALDNVSLYVKRGTVHALLGENGAGKSTLMKILSGIYQMDSGEILINSRPVHIGNPHEAQMHGICMIHQELSLLPDLSVSANVYLGREPISKIFHLVDRKKMTSETSAILKEIGAPVYPDTCVRELSVAEAQMVEIAKAISYDSDIIVMDEPTSAITNTEVQKLFEVIGKLKSQGKAIIYISHKMDEIFRIADEITVLRDGQMVGSNSVEELDINKLISMMVGRELDKQYAEKNNQIGEVVFEVRKLSRKHKFNDISFSVREGEILGIAGLMGAGRTEIVETIFGMEKADSGEICINGKKADIRSPGDAIAHGMAFVPEDRKQKGLNLVGSLKENITIANLKKYCVGNQIIRGKEERVVSEEYINRLSVKPPDTDKLVGSLSGGNQQKVVLARWMSCNPNIMILDEPTRGIDVGAKAEIYRLISEYASAGKAVIMISSELPEILGMSDRIIVIHSGTITGEFKKTEEITQEAVMAHATGIAERGA